MIALAMWSVGSVLVSFAAGWLVGHYGHARRDLILQRQSNRIASELLRVNAREEIT